MGKRPGSGGRGIFNLKLVNSLHGLCAEKGSRAAGRVLSGPVPSSLVSQFPLNKEMPGLEPCGSIWEEHLPVL